MVHSARRLARQVRLYGIAEIVVLAAQTVGSMSGERYWPFHVARWAAVSSRCLRVPVEHSRSNTVHARTARAPLEPVES